MFPELLRMVASFWLSLAVDVTDGPKVSLNPSTGTQGFSGELPFGLTTQ